MSATIEAVRGMRDVLPAEQRQVAAARRALEATFEAYGYEPIDLPIIESRELYLRKLGEELAGKVYEFNFGGRDLALRPEWTASVLRAYVAHLRDQPLPLRLSYSGPVFRYERPQRHTHRQFTQVGIEIVGGPSPRADAEALALACAGLDAVGVTGYRVLMGHVGVARELLAQFDLTERTRDTLVWSLERIRKEGAAVVREHLHERAGEPPIDLPPGLDEEQARAWLLRTLQAMEIELSTGTRSREQVVARLLRKLRRRDERAAIERALDVLERLVTVHGPASRALPALAALLEEQGLQARVLDEVRAILALVAAHGIDPDQIDLDFGLGRGLHYYTGLIFEIADGNGTQLCGGGRYDDLVAALGGPKDVPAVGFAYGLERVVAAATAPAPAGRPLVLVAPVADDDYAYAQDVARRLRERGLAVSVDVRGRTLARNLSDATRRGARYVVIIGVEERTSRSFVWRDLERHDERRLSLDALGDL
ncbi:MAG: ATP phosphoribosyltransferase regulatory subunit [Oscillochloridaceae bacterium]|nr:ATP phosphoribosyltransferase regulatory subunit [Chloroflexaceae bacterium]MDW8391541.1 ATP phosphoribosyltransferase regulatory subunit [Oscillochloridaceae bacterium]